MQNYRYYWSYTDFEVDIPAQNPLPSPAEWVCIPVERVCMQERYLASRSNSQAAMMFKYGLFD
jgi:hypothetical protein